MNDEERTAIVNAVVGAQASATACGFIVAELLVRSVVNQPDPPEALRQMFDAISSRIDRATDDLGEQPRSVSEARKIVEDMFSSLDKALQRPKRRGRGPPRP